MGAGDPRRELPRLAAPIFYAARRARDLRLHLRERGASLEIGPDPRPSVKPRLAPGVVGTSPEAAADPRTSVVTRSDPDAIGLRVFRRGQRRPHDATRLRDGRGAVLEVGPDPRPSVKPRLAPVVVGTSPEAAADPRPSIVTRSDPGATGLRVFRRGRRRPRGTTRPRDARRAAAHQSWLSSRGLRKRAPAFVPGVYVHADTGTGYVPARQGRPGRRALVALHPGREQRRHAVPHAPRPSGGGDTRAGDPRASSLVSWAMRLPRLLRATRCALSLYLESTMRPPPAGLRAREGDPLPAPLRPWRIPPLPRSPRRRTAWALNGAAHVWTNCIVAVLSHLAMGRAAVAPPHARAGAPMSDAQRAIWEGVHARVLTFLRDAREVSGGAALATAEAEVAELERLLEAELVARGGYGDGVRGVALGSEGAGLAPFVAADIALPKRGAFFDLAEFLPDAEVRAAYVDPDTLLTGGDASGEPPSRDVPRGALLGTAELVRLCKRLDAAGILALVPASEAEDISPVFAVRKKFDAARGVWSLRLLFDRRRRNARERHLLGASRDLPHAACFLDIVLEPTERIEIDASDLECFYYTARVSSERAARNVFGRPLRASMLAECSCCDPALGDRLVVPALATLAMGDRNACDFAQAAHREVLLRAGALDPASEVHYGAPLPRSRVLHGVMIDDRLSLAIVAPGPDGETAVARSAREWDAAMAAYAASCGRPVPEKTQRRARAGRVWGAWLDGDRGTLGGPPERRAALALLTLRLARCGFGSPALVRRLLGSWVFHLMFRRSAFAVPDEAFRFAQSDGEPTHVARLPPGVRAELASLALLAPLLETSLRAPVAPVLWCTDASPHAGAVVRAPLPALVARELWRHRDARGSHVRITPAREDVADLRDVMPSETAVLQQCVVELVAAGHGSDPQVQALAEACREREASDRCERSAAAAQAPAGREEWVSELVQALPFDLVLRYPFQRSDHINILEANVRLSLVKHLARSPSQFATRQLLGQDSRVCLGAFAKGRSSARRLNHVEAKVGAYELAADIQTGGLWVDSFRMPADAPTREGGIVLPCPARPWVSAFLSGDFAALDARLAA